MLGARTGLRGSLHPAAVAWQQPREHCREVTHCGHSSIQNVGFHKVCHQGPSWVEHWGQLCACVAHQWAWTIPWDEAKCGIFGEGNSPPQGPQIYQCLPAATGPSRLLPSWAVPGGLALGWVLGQGSPTKCCCSASPGLVSKGSSPATDTDPQSLTGRRGLALPRRQETQPSCKVQGPGSAMPRPRTRGSHLVPALQVPKTLGETQGGNRSTCAGTCHSMWGLCLMPTCPFTRAGSRSLAGQTQAMACVKQVAGQTGRLLEPGKPGTGPRLG